MISIGEQHLAYWLNDKFQVKLMCTTPELMLFPIGGFLPCSYHWLQHDPCAAGNSWNHASMDAIDKDVSVFSLTPARTI